MNRVQELPRREWPARSRGSWRHVYLIQEGEDGPVKIGIAANAFWRISDLQVGNCRRLRLIAVFICEDNADARAIEQWTHYQLEDAHISGEWFNVPPEEAASLIRARCTS